MALTQAQIALHWGAMLSFTLDRLALGDPPPAAFVLENFIRLAVAYTNDGIFGTQADRTEAMKSFVRKLFTSLTAGDSAVQGHYFAKHWLAADRAGADLVLG